MGASGEARESSVDAARVDRPRAEGEDPCQAEP
jgi:hypothetical protein